MRSEVNNRRLFKKATEARDKLRQMGGIATMPQPQVMTQAPRRPMAGGIMASSRDLMQAAALPRPVVLPRTNQPMQMPAAQGQAPMLPPSQPIPNIAGIQQMNQPMAQAPRPMAKPMAQKPPVKKLAGGGPPMSVSYDNKSLPFVSKEGKPVIDFSKAFKFGQKAVTEEGAAELGLPAEIANVTKTDLEGKPEDVSKNIIESELPEEQKTGDTKKDLITTATNLGIESVPAEAEIDEINKAIAGAKLGAALAGNYVNPNTGQAIRPTAGARISSAVADSLMVSRDTETRRAKQEADLAKALIAARAKDKEEGFLDSELGKAMLKSVDTLGGKANYTEADLTDQLISSYGSDAVTKFYTALGRSTPAASDTTVTETTVTETASTDTSFNPTHTLKDGTPIMKQGNKWVDQQGNDRSNG
tara:strand:+ start:571 stop:1821 length:1251 start_codon:yes stop_codon:yes gene_type:complete